MNKHYERYLTVKYAPLYKNRDASSMNWRFACNDGWFNIINTLSYHLCHSWLHAKKKYDQMKQHEGKLLYKVSWGGNEPESERNYRITDTVIERYRIDMEKAEECVPIARQVKEKYGGLRFYADNMSENHYMLINFAQSLSLTTCEICGKMGKQINAGWITTRCKEHRME